MSSANGVVGEAKQIGGGVTRETNNQTNCSSPSVCSSEDLFQLEMKIEDNQHDNICCGERGQTKTCAENNSFLSTSTSHRSDCSANSANSFAFPMYVGIYV